MRNPVLHANPELIEWLRDAPDATSAAALVAGLSVSSVIRALRAAHGTDWEGIAAVLEARQLSAGCQNTSYSLHVPEQQHSGEPVQTPQLSLDSAPEVAEVRAIPEVPGSGWTTFIDRSLPKGDQ